MPLKALTTQFRLSPEDADLIESVFNQLGLPEDDPELRSRRAAELVNMFVDGERDRKKLVDYLLCPRSLSERATSATPGPS